MPDLLLPPHVQREIQKAKWAEQRREYRAVLDRLLDFNDPVCLEWNPHLRDLDPLLRLGRARPMAYEPGWPVVPGFYHWVRDNENTVPTVTTITGPGDSFIEPDSGVLEDLQRSDLQNPRVFQMLLEKRKQRELAKEKARQVEREERQQEILDRWKAGTETRVSLTDVPWSQSVKGRKR